MWCRSAAATEKGRRGRAGELLYNYSVRGFARRNYISSRTCGRPENEYAGGRVPETLGLDLGVRALVYIPRGTLSIASIGISSIVRNKWIESGTKYATING